MTNIKLKLAAAAVVALAVAAVGWLAWQRSDSAGIAAATNEAKTQAAFDGDAGRAYKVPADAAALRRDLRAGLASAARSARQPADDARDLADRAAGLLDAYAADSPEPMQKWLAERGQTIGDYWADPAHAEQWGRRTHALRGAAFDAAGARLLVLKRDGKPTGLAPAGTSLVTTRTPTGPADVSFEDASDVVEVDVPARLQTKDGRPFNGRFACRFARKAGGAWVLLASGYYDVPPATPLAGPPV